MKPAHRRRLLRTQRRRLMRTREIPVHQETQEEALAALAIRTEANKTRTRAGNSFDCLKCAGEIVVPDDYVTRPYLCTLCQPLSDKGWI